MKTCFGKWQAQMNDASEVLGVIFDCLHQSFTSRLGLPDMEPNVSNCMGLWECSNKACMAHFIFGMNIFELMDCQSCQLESRHLKYTSFFHNINASALRTMKVCLSSRYTLSYNHFFIIMVFMGNLFIFACFHPGHVCR